MLLEGVALGLLAGGLVLGRVGLLMLLFYPTDASPDLCNKADAYRKKPPYGGLHQQATEIATGYPTDAHPVRLGMTSWPCQ